MAIDARAGRRRDPRRSLPVVLGLPFLAIAVSAGCWHPASVSAAPASGLSTVVHGPTVATVPFAGPDDDTPGTAHAPEVAVAEAPPAPALAPLPGRNALPANETAGDDPGLSTRAERAPPHRAG
jgi:hypothetical protein